MNQKRQALDVARKGHEHRYGTSGQVGTVGDRQRAAMFARLEGWVGRQLSVSGEQKKHDGWNFKLKAYMGHNDKKT